MKTSLDKRHLKRVKIIQELFAWEFQPKKNLSDPETVEIINHIKTIDKIIATSATEWPIAQINKIDLSILRLAIFELIIKKDIPFKVVVDEAVELAKEFGSESSPNFINGVLGNVIIKKDLEKGE